jgi:hypothetical protein
MSKKHHHHRKTSLDDVYGFGGGKKSKHHKTLMPSAIPSLPSIGTTPRLPQSPPQSSTPPLPGPHPPPPPPPPPPPDPDQLHTPTFTPKNSGSSHTDVVIACSDLGADLFYTVGNPPPDPVHVGDVAIPPTIRMGANAGHVDSGDGGNKMKAVAYQSGFIDSDIATSDQYGTVPVGDRPILTGLIQLLPADPDRNGIRLTDISDSAYPAWNMDYCDGFRYRALWKALEPTQGVYDWVTNPTTNIIKLLFDKAAAKGKYISFNVSSGKACPRWLFDSVGALEYFIHDTGGQDDFTINDCVFNGTTTITSATARFNATYDTGKALQQSADIPASTVIASVTNATTAVLNNATNTSGSGKTIIIKKRVGTQPLPWDPLYQTPWFTFLDALKNYIASLSSHDQLRGMIDCGFMMEASMELGDLVDKGQPNATVAGYGMPTLPYGYANSSLAYQTSAAQILAHTWANWPTIAHILTNQKVWDGGNFDDTNAVLNAYKALHPGRVGTINTSLRATYIAGGDHGPGNVGSLPTCAQQVFAMTNATDIGGAHPYTAFYPGGAAPPTFTDCGSGHYGGALGCLYDCMGHAWDVGDVYCEVYAPDFADVGGVPILRDAQLKLKGNLA